MLGCSNNSRVPIRTDGFDLSESSDFDESDAIQWSQLYGACETGSFGKFRQFILDSSDKVLNKTDFDKNTMLHLSCKTENFGITKLLLARRPRLDIRNSSGKTLVHIVSLKLNVGLLNLLKEAGAPLDVADSLGDTPLLCLCRKTELVALDLKKQGEIAFSLISGGASIFSINGMGNSIFHLLTDAGNFSLNKELCPKNHAIIDSANKRGETALHRACIAGRIDCAKIFIQNGAKVDLKDNKKKVPFDYLNINERKDLEELYRDTLRQKKTAN